jgi:probable F420-dependent oxidoreductase
VRFGVALPTAYEGLGYPIGFARDPAVFARLARVAEECGYDGVWANDHVVTPAFLRAAAEGRPGFMEPLVVLAYVAAVTERIRIGTAVLALPLRDPVALAKQAATLDALSGGRLTLGVGIGAFADELAAARPERAHAGASVVFAEMIDALRALLDKGGGSYDGAVVRYADVELAPPPRQRPLPIYVGGHSVAAIERAARWGQGWIPGWRPLRQLRERIGILREHLAARGRDAHAVAIAPELSAMIGSDHRATVRRYESSLFVRHRRARDRTGRDPSLMAASNLVGSGDRIRERVAELADAGVDECAALAFPAESVDELIAQWRSFADEVVARAR